LPFFFIDVSENRRRFQRIGDGVLLSGRISSPDVQELKARLGETRGPVALELQQVRLDLDAVRFLAVAERGGVELRHVPPFVRAWILVERPNLSDVE